MSATMRAISRDEIVQGDCKNCQIQETLNIILSEVRALRRERLLGDPRHIEELLSTLHIIFTDSEFTAAWVLETCTENDSDAVRLRACITYVIGSNPTINRLSRFLRKAIGQYGNYELTAVNLHSRDGATFAVYRVTM